MERLGVLPRFAGFRFGSLLKALIRADEAYRAQAQFNRLDARSKRDIGVPENTTWAAPEVRNTVLW